MDPWGATMMELKSLGNWDDMEWETVRPGVKRKGYQAGGGTLVLNHLEPGHSPKPHSHPQEQIVSILRGEAEFTVNAKVFNLRSGSLLTIPPNAEHFARVTGKEVLINLDVFIPGREDYRQSRILGKE
jgi:quercetin dioxygenase-like cupin family protein